MNLLIVRHAIAEDREDFAQTGRPDEERPLTAPGIKKMKKIARRLGALVPKLDRLATSPLLRARQTADLLASVYDELEPVVLGELTPDVEPIRVEEWLRKQDDVDTLALVGHEPHLGQLVGFLLSGQPTPLVALKKGGACLLRWTVDSHATAAELHWLLTPRQLRQLEARPRGAEA